MKVRTFTAGIGAAALAVSGLALGAAGPAAADPGFVPGPNDIVGVGSDTIEFVVQNLADSWNSTGTPAYKVASWNATGSATITPRLGAADVPRPNGSGSGKATLFGAGNNTAINFARSSSSLSTTEAAALTQFPFAVDGLKLAVSGQQASHAPTSITAAQMVKIYDGTYTHWNQIPGNAAGSTAAIKPMTPQSGSGTRSFFESELKAANGGVAVTYGADVTFVQEHDPSLIQNDPDAIAPFSTARQATLATPSVIHLEGGYRARRAVYDVVRNADAGSAWVADLFGAGATPGFWCSAAGRTIITNAGFEPLATTATPGGQCGLPLTAPPANLNVQGAASSTTTLAASSPSLHTVDLDATLDHSAGVVQFFDGSTQVGADAAIVLNHATVHLTNVAGGSHTYTAKFLSNDTSAVNDSQGSKTVSVIGTSTTTATVTPGTFGHGGSATVSVNAETGSATGNVTINVGGHSATAALSGGSVTFAIPGTFSAGSQSFTASYAGNATTAPSADTKVYNVGRSSIAVSETFKAKIKHGKRAVGTIVVALAPTTSIKPSGAILVKKGTKVVGKGTLVNGVATIKLAKLPKGKNKLVATYSGSADVLGGALKFLITQK
jgi:ABC-type phosphate transport system substrate-binding protein